MADFMMKVSPEEMIHQADEIKRSVESVRNSFAAVEERVRRSSGYWEGEASKLHSSRFAKVKERCDEVARRLSEHPDDLLKMAGLYSESEMKSTAESNSLQSNVFS